VKCPEVPASEMLHGGFIIKTVRLYRQFSQSEVSFQYGITEKTLRNWEKQRRDPHFGHVQAICEDILRVPLIDAIVMARDELEKQSGGAA